MNELSRLKPPKGAHKKALLAKLLARLKARLGVGTQERPNPNPNSIPRPNAVPNSNPDPYQVARPATRT